MDNTAPPRDTPREDYRRSSVTTDLDPSTQKDRQKTPPAAETNNTSAATPIPSSANATETPDIEIDTDEPISDPALEPDDDLGDPQIPPLLRRKLLPL